MAIMHFVLLLAAVQTPEPLTLREAARLASGEAPSVSRVRAETEAAEARAIAARSRLAPSLSLEGGFLSTDDPTKAFSLALEQQRFSADRFFAADPNRPPFVRDWSAAVALDWRADLFGSARAEARAAARTALSGGRLAGRARDAAVLEAIEAFAAARRADKAISELALRRADAEKDLDVARALHEQGMTTQADPARAEAAVAQVDAEAAGERAALASARARLAALIGSAAASRPLADLPPAGPVNDPRTGDRDDVAAAKLSAEAAREAAKAASASRFPALVIQARYEAHAPRPGGRWGDAASVFGGVRAPVFTFGGVQARIAEASAAARAAAMSEIETRRFAETQNAEARAALEAADSRVAAFARAGAAARRAREIQQARYEEGAARLSDLIEVRAAELAARLGEAAAMSERAIAEARLRFALGLPPEGEER
jgi:outer membrane protein TolC